jgi:hypothetical protein
MLTDHPGNTGWTPPLRRDPDAIKPTAYALIIGFAGDHNATEANRISGVGRTKGCPVYFAWQLSQISIAGFFSIFSAVRQAQAHSVCSRCARLPV